MTCTKNNDLCTCLNKFYCLNKIMKFLGRRKYAKWQKGDGRIKIPAELLELLST